MIMKSLFKNPLILLILFASLYSIGVVLLFHYEFAGIH